MLSIKNLVVQKDEKTLLDKLSLHIEKGSVEFLMGSNGAGKSTLAQVIAGKKFSKISGEVKFLNQDLLNLEPGEISKLGIFLSFQNPVEVPGVSLVSFLRDIKKKQFLEEKKEFLGSEFLKELKENVLKLGLNEDFYKRDLNFGFSGGEKKKSEVLQILTLKPKLIILDEIDSGLDVDSLKTIMQVLKSYQQNNECSLLIITHQIRLLNFIKPNKVNILSGGKIVKSGTVDLALAIQEKGFSQFL